MVYNRTHADLRIVEIKKGCSCETVEAPEVIPARGHAKITMVLDTGNEAKATTKHATLVTDSIEHPRIRIEARGWVTQFCEIKPQHVIIEDLPGAEVDCSFTVEPATNLQIVDMCLAETDEEERRFDGTVSFTPDSGSVHVAISTTVGAKTKHIKVPFEITTEDGSTRRKSIPVSIKALPRVVCRPQHALVFDTSSVGGKKGMRQSIELRASRPDVSFSVKEARCMKQFKDLLRVEVEPVEKHRVYKVHVDLIGEPECKWLRDRLAVVIDDGGTESQIELAVVARFEGKPSFFAERTAE